MFNIFLTGFLLKVTVYWGKMFSSDEINMNTRNLKSLMVFWLHEAMPFLYMCW